MAIGPICGIMAGGTGWITTPNCGMLGTIGGKRAPGLIGLGSKPGVATGGAELPTICGWAAAGFSWTGGLKISPNIGIDGMSPILGIPTAVETPGERGGAVAPVISGVAGLAKVSFCRPEKRW